ncbi:MAG: hypothetical protein U0175_03235 [Caldilineaceae bacterium]
MEQVERQESQIPEATLEQTNWHLLLGMLLKALLGFVGIIVQTEVNLARKPLKLDILLIRRDEPFWTEAQFARLPDGIRQRSEPNILCEFKYTESLNRDALVQALNYETLYRIENELKDTQLATFVVSAKTPQRKFLAEYGYTKSEMSGVYRTTTAGWNRVGLIVLNELSDEAHNAFFKCFASRKNARKAAFGLLERLDGTIGTAAVWEIVAGLRSLFAEAEEKMMNEIVVTPEYVQSLGAGIRRMIINTMTPKERLEGLAPEERVEGLAPEERLEGLSPEEIVAQFDAEDLLARMDSAVIEAFLRQRAAVVQKKDTKVSSTSKKPKSRKPRNKHSSA